MAYSSPWCSVLTVAEGTDTMESLLRYNHHLTVCFENSRILLPESRDDICFVLLFFFFNKNLLLGKVLNKNSCIF